MATLQERWRTPTGRPLVVLADPGRLGPLSRFDIEQSILNGHGIDWKLGTGPCEAEIVAAARDADVLAVVGVQVTGRLLDALPRVRCVVRYGVGIDTLDLEACTARGVAACNVPAYCVPEVADHAAALLLACHRRLLRLDRQVRQGEWRSAALRGLRRATALTVGIVGFGRIGRAVAHRLGAFGFRLLAWDPFVSASEMASLGVARAHLDELLQESDFVSLHTPLTPETRHLIAGRQLRLMKPSAYLVNTARGVVVDQEALVEALQEGRIAGAALDVQAVEPMPADSPLARMENVILTPHAAYFSEEASAVQKRIVAQEAVRVLRGEWPLGLCNPDLKAQLSLRPPGEVGPG